MLKYFYHSEHSPARSASPSTTGFRAPRGVSAIELIVSMILLGALLATSIPLMRWVQLQRREIDRREVALQSANRLLEEFTTRNWNDVTQSAANELKLDDSAAAELTQPELNVSVSDIEGSPAARRVNVSVTWENSAGTRVAPISLDTFVFKRRAQP